MELLTYLIMSVLAALVAAEVVGKTKSIATFFLKVALSRLPKQYRDRFKEEWSADLRDTNGPISRIFVSWGFVLASLKLTIFEKKKMWMTERKIPVEKNKQRALGNVRSNLIRNMVVHNIGVQEKITAKLKNIEEITRTIRESDEEISQALIVTAEMLTKQVEVIEIFIKKLLNRKK